ncbi:MAG: hypothetical protein FJX56_14390 [Alphaproteobacteria bacterium]|nr:hypothetical protein [Alphaproteobacteria bacterium]
MLAGMENGRGVIAGRVSRQTLILGVALAALLLYVADMVRSGGEGFSLLPRGPAVGAPFALSDPGGAIVRESDFAGQFRLITFATTRCAAICSDDLAAMREARVAAAAAGGAVAAIVVVLDLEPFATVGLAPLAGRFPGEISVLGGPVAEVAALAAAYGVVPAALVAEESAGFVFLMGPDGGYVAHFPAGTARAELIGAVLGYMELS